MTEMIDQTPAIPLTDEPGSYRLRVSARGREVDRDEDERGGEEPLESYLLDADRIGRLLDDLPQIERRIVRVGGLTRPDLQSALAAAGVRLNASAETLLDNPMFASPEVETVEIVERTVGQLGLINGATLPRIMASAREQGLMLCPPITGPHLRLSMPDQPIAPDSVMSNGRPPRGAVHVASERLRDEYDYPRGFYLRVVEGTRWLRGFRCSDEAPWSSDDRFAFRSPGPPGDGSLGMKG